MSSSELPPESARLTKVLSVIHYPTFGGPHNQALVLSEPLAERGFHTIVVLPQGADEAAERLRASGVDVTVMPLHRLRATLHPRAHFEFLTGLIGEISRLRKLIRAEKIALVQIGGLVNPHAAIAARLEGVPTVWQLLDTRAPKAVAIAAMAWVWQLADVVMSTGVAVAASHPGYSAIADRVIPFFPPVQLERFAPHPELRAEVHSSWGLPEGTLVVGCVANINPQKGIVELVRAFAKARVAQLDARLVLIGAEDPAHSAYSVSVRQAIANEGLAEGTDVVFLGGRDDVDRQLAGMDILALAAPRRSEGVTTSILEAMAAGVPVVATNVGAIREAVANGRTGLLVPPDDIGALASAISKLLAEPALRFRLGHEAGSVARARFGVDTSADTHARAYTRALLIRGKNGRIGVSPPPKLRLKPGQPLRIIGGLTVLVGNPHLLDHDDTHHRPTRRAESTRSEPIDGLAENDFEIMRPHATPRLYRFFIAEKFRRAIGPIRTDLIGASALTVCGGSGMDAEFLFRAGASVISSDLSVAAALRAKTRFQQYGLEIESVVADVTDLWLADRSVDLVAVHDGLHHLEDPYVGLSEMARVAKRWVIVTEPARASITRLAVRMGLALETEPAGTRVARMDPAEVAEFLKDRGYKVLRADRYAMYYPHRPGYAFSQLSRPVAFQLVRLGWRFANALIGAFGNKMVVVAERHESAAAPWPPMTGGSPPGVS